MPKWYTDVEFRQNVSVIRDHTLDYSAPLSIAWTKSLTGPKEASWRVVRPLCEADQIRIYWARMTTLEKQINTRFYA